MSLTTSYKYFCNTKYAFFLNTLIEVLCQYIIPMIDNSSNRRLDNRHMCILENSDNTYINLYYRMITLMSCLPTIAIISTTSLFIRK